jgi:hypothetical protein
MHAVTSVAQTLDDADATRDIESHARLVWISATALDRSRPRIAPRFDIGGTRTAERPTDLEFTMRSVLRRLFSPLPVPRPVPRLRPRRDALRPDPFFADPEVVEDDYRRMRRS